MSQPFDPWALLRHQAEQTERFLTDRRRRRDRRITIRQRGVRRTD